VSVDGVVVGTYAVTATITPAAGRNVRITGDSARWARCVKSSSQMMPTSGPIPIWRHKIRQRRKFRPNKPTILSAATSMTGYESCRGKDI